MPKARTKAEHLMREEHKRLKAHFGGGWNYFHRNIKHALMRDHVVSVIRGQDDGEDAVRAERILAFFHELVDAATNIIDEEEGL